MEQIPVHIEGEEVIAGIAFFLEISNTARYGLLICEKGCDGSAGLASGCCNCFLQSTQEEGAPFC